MSSDSSSPPVLLEPNVAALYGPILIGSLLNYLLLGTLFVQLYIYVNSGQRQKDPIWARSLVSCVFLVDLAQSVIVTQLTWQLLILSWGRTDLLTTKIPWSGAVVTGFDGLLAWMIQSFYAWRIWTLTTTGWIRILPVLIVVLSIVQWAGSLAATILILKADGSTASLTQITGGIDPWLIGSFINDIIIAACMITLLYKARSRTVWVQSKSLYDRLITNTIQTGLVTALVAGVDLFLWKQYPAEYYHMTAAIILGKLYSNALLSTINGRVFRDHGSDSQQLASTGINNGAPVGVQIHIAQQRERRIDEPAENRNSNLRTVAKKDQRLVSWKPRTSTDDDAHIYELSTLSKTLPATSSNDNDVDIV
ncbi:unnamed protein product [Peniophora sp. CBMAI 1063]|nr:unnamed protein product [Peniophora sp. CBMAI 1063]